MSIIELLTDLASGTNSIIRSTSSKFNLTASQGFHLLSIPFNGIPMSGLANKLGLDNSTLTRNIQKLEKIELVQRFPDSYDRRVQIVKLTPKGASLLEHLEGSLEKISDNLIDQIDLDTQEHLVTVLEKLSWSLDLRRSES